MSQKELPLVALLKQEKIGFSPAGFSLPSGAFKFKSLKV